VNTIGAVERRSIDDDVVINLSGKYEFVVTHNNIRNMEENSSLLVKWAWDDRKLKDQPKYVLSSRFGADAAQKISNCCYWEASYWIHKVSD
jgi:hypothetical protein